VSYVVVAGGILYKYSFVASLWSIILGFGFSRDWLTNNLPAYHPFHFTAILPAPMANNPAANGGDGYVRKISAQAETDEKPLGRVKDMQRFLMDFEKKNKEDNQRHVYQKKAGPRPWEVKKMEQQQKQEEEKLKQEEEKLKQEEEKLKQQEELQKQEEELQKQQEEKQQKQEEELQNEGPAVQEEEKEEKEEEDFDKEAEEEEDEEASAMDDFGKSSRCACVLLHM
jgi:flagellar biosynthesis GTPase FlhF